jgi:hypothetical protein
LPQGKQRVSGWGGIKSDRKRTRHSRQCDRNEQGAGWEGGIAVILQWCKSNLMKLSPPFSTGTVRIVKRGERIGFEGFNPDARI